MKKVLMIATAAFLISGIAFAQDKKSGAKKCDKGMLQKGRNEKRLRYEKLYKKRNF